MLAPSASSFTTRSAVRTGTAPLPLSGCTLPPTALATERMSLSATTTTAASLPGGLIPGNPSGSGVRALQTGAAALCYPLLLSDRYNRSATTLPAHQPQPALPSTPADEARATENATWYVPAEAVGQAAAPAWENHAAAGTAAPRATQCNLRDLHRQRAPVIATTALAAVEAGSKDVLAALPGGAGGTESVSRTAAAYSAEGATLPAYLGSTAACVQPARAEAVSTALEPKLKAAARPQVLLADPLLVNIASEEGAVSAARQQQQQWRQAELLQRQRELQQRLLVLQEQQRQRDAAAGAERWSSCRWISTTSDVASEEEEGQFSVSDAKAGTVSFGGPSGSSISSSISLPKEPVKQERYQLATAPSDSSVEARNSPKSTSVGKATLSTAAGAAVADALAAAADHTTPAAADSPSTGENTPAGLKVKIQEECEDRVLPDFTASRATNATSTSATCMVFPAAVTGKVHVANSLGHGINRLSFPYLFWQEDGDVEAVVGVTEEPSETSTHAHSGSSSPTEEPASGPLTSRGAAATAPANAAATPVADCSTSSDKLQHDRICYPFPEAAVLWDSSSSCCIDELPPSAAFDEEHYQQLPQHQSLPLQHSFSAQQPHTQQQQDSHEDQQARLRLHSLQQQRGQRTVSSATILPSECADAGARVPSVVEFSSSYPAGRGTQIGRNSADSERGAAAVTEAGATAGGCALYLPCSSRQGTGCCSSAAGESKRGYGGGPTRERAAGTTAEETSADGAAVAEAEIHNSVAVADRETCSTAAVSIHSRGDRVAAAGTAAAGRTVTSSNWSGLIGGAAEKEAAAQEVVVELRRVTKTRAATAAATGEVEGKRKHLLLQFPTATTSPRKIVPLHRHWMQQLLLQQKKHQQRVQRLQQQQQRLRQQRQRQGKRAHNAEPPQQHVKQQQVQDIKQQQRQHTSHQHPTREQQHHQLWRGDRALQQRNTGRQSEGDDHLHTEKRCCKPGIAAAAVEETKRSIREKPPATQLHTVSSFDAAAASCADESGLTRNTNAIHVSAAHSAVPASASPAPGASGAASAAPLDPAVAPCTVPVDCSDSATAAPGVAAAGTAVPLGAAAVLNHPSCPAAPPVSAAEGVPLWPSFDAQSSLHKSRDVCLASAPAADRSLRRAAGAEAQCPAAAGAVDVSVISAPSLRRGSFSQSPSSVPTAKKNTHHVYAGSDNGPAVAVHQQGECWPTPHENLRLTIPGLLPPASAATSASLASGAVGGGVAHLDAASAADVWSATAPLAAPIQTAAQREQKARSSEPRVDGPVDAPLSHNILPLKGRTTMLQQPWAVERWSSACATAPAPATAQQSGLPEKSTPAAASKNFGATASAPQIAAAVPNFAAIPVAEAPAPRVVCREKGTTVSAALEGTKERTKNNATTKARNSRRTDARQRLNSNSGTGERHCNREKAATLAAAAAAEGNRLGKKTGGRIASTPQRLRKLHTHAQQQPERSLQEEQQQVVEDELIVRGRHVASRGAIPVEEIQRERHQQQHDTANKRVDTDTGKKNSLTLKEEETGRGAMFGEDTANRVKLQQTLRRLRASLLLDTWETGSPDTAHRQKKNAEHSSSSGPHHDSSCSSRGKRQQHSSTSNRRSSHCGAAARPSQTSVAGMNFSHLSRSSNGLHGLAAYLPKGNEAAGESGGGSKDMQDVRALWKGKSNGKDRKERQRNPLVEAGATAAVNAAVAAAAGAGEPAEGRTSTEACGNRLQQLFTSTTGSNTGQEKYGRQQKEQREQQQHQWRPDEGEGAGRKDGEYQTTGDLSYDSSRGSPNCTSTSSSRCSNRGAHASRSRRRNSSITSCTPSTILRRLRRLLQKESSPCSLEWSQKVQAKRHDFSSSCSSSRSRSQRRTSTQWRGRSRRNNKNSDSDSRSGNHRASSSGSPTYSRSVSPSSTSSCRSGSISCKEIAEASKRMWSRLLKHGSRRMARSSRISSPSRHGAGVSSKSSGSGRRVSNSGSSCFTESSSEESSSEGSSSNSASNSGGARSSSFTDKHSDGDGSDFPGSWIKRLRHKMKRNLTAAADYVPAVDGAAAAGCGAATDGTPGAFPTGSRAAVVGEGRAAAPSGKGEDPAPSLISLWLQYSAAALEESDKQQQQQAAQGKQQLEEKVHADRIQRSFGGSNGYCLPATSGSKTRTGGNSRGRRNRRCRGDSSNSNQSSSRSGREGSALWQSSSRSSGRGGSSTSTANTPSDEDSALILDPDAFIRRIKRRLRLPLSPRLESRQQQQRQKQYSSEVSGSSNKCPGRDNLERQRRRDTDRTHKHRQQHQQQRLRQLHERQLKRQEVSGEGATDAPESKTDVDREQQQRDEKQHHGRFVHSHEEDEQVTGDAIKMQRKPEQHIAIFPGGATTGAAAAASSAAVAAGVDDPSGPLRLSALGSPTPSLAALDAEVQLHRQQEDKLRQQEQHLQQEKTHAQKEEERRQDEEEQQLQQTKQQQSHNEPCQQERGPESPQRLETGLRRNASPCRAATTADDDNAVGDQLTAGGACETVRVMHASLPGIAAVERGQTEIPAAAQLSEAAVDAVSGAVVGQVIETAYTAVLTESADDVTARNERTALPRAYEETDYRKDYDKRATAADALFAEKRRIEPQHESKREQGQQKSVNTQEKETSERQVEIQSWPRQQEAGQQDAETQQQQHQQHGEMRQLHQTAQQQEQPVCRIGEKQSAPAVAAKNEAYEGEKMLNASSDAQVLQLQPLLCRAQKEDLPSGQQQAPVTTKDVQSVADPHAATALRAPATADLVSNASASSAAESRPSDGAADVAPAAKREADAAVAPVNAAVLADTDAARVRVTAEHVDASPRTEDTDDTIPAAGVTAGTEAAGAEVQGDALDDLDVLPASATRVAPCNVVSREQQNVTAAAVGSGSTGSPGAATAAGRGFTSVTSTSSVISFSFSLSSSSGSSRSLDSSTSSSNRTVKSNVANNDGCLHNTSSSSLGSAECRSRRFLPESAATAEYGLSREDSSTTPCAAAKPTAGAAAGGPLYRVPDAEGHFAAADAAKSRMAGAAKTLDSEVTSNRPAVSAASCSMCQLPGSPGAPRTAAAEEGSTAAVSGERQSATVETAELPSAGGEAASNGCHEWRRSSSAGLQPQPVRSPCSSDRSHYRRGQRETFLKEANQCFLDVKAEGTSPTATTAHANFDELAAAAARAPSRRHVDARAACPGGWAAELCAGTGYPLVCATPQDEQHQSQQREEVLREMLLTKEAPPPEVLALLKQQQRQLQSSTADFRLPAYRCTHGKKEWLPLLSPTAAKHTTQQEEGQRQQAEQQEYHHQQQKPRDQRRKRSKLQQQVLQSRTACAAAPSPVCVAGAADVSASRRGGGQAGDVRDEIASFVEIVSLVLGGGKEAEGSVASGNSAARPTIEALLADAALCSKSSVTIHDKKILVERPPLAADTGPQMRGRDCKLADAVSSVSVRASAEASLPAHYCKGEWFAAALAELQQRLRERKGFSCRGVADPPLQPFVSSSSSLEKSQDAGRMQEQSYAQGGKRGAKSSKRSTVGAVRCGNGTATDAADVEAGERSSTSKCPSLRICGGVRTAAAPRKKEKKEAAQCVCPKASEEVQAFTANVCTECEPQTTMKDRHFHGARAAWRWCSALQKEGPLSAAAAAGQCTEKYRRVQGHAEKAPTSSSRRLTNRRSRCSTGLRHFSSSGGHANRLNSVYSKQQNDRTKSRSSSGRSSIDSTELSDRSTRDERCAGKVHPCVHTRAAGTGGRTTKIRCSSSSKCSSPSYDACGCASAYSKESGNGKLQNSSRSTSSRSSTTSCCFSAYEQQEVEERGTAQQQSPTQGASKPDCRTNRSVRRLHRQRHHWHEPRQQQRQHQKQHRRRGDRQGSADGVEHRAERFLEHFQDVACGYTGQCFTCSSQQQQQQLRHQQQQMVWSCRREAGHTSSRRRALEQSRSLSRSSLVCEQKGTRSSSCLREQPPETASSFPQGEGQLLQGAQGLPQERDEIGVGHDLGWCWREWGGCEIYKEQRSRLQVMLRGALKGQG